SELMKPCIVLACAKFYDMLPPNETRRFGAIWPSALLILIPAALVMKQPDLGTALMIVIGGVTVMFLAGVPLRLFIGGGLALAAAVPLAVN
ncbi:FtsW/RodA/SpoVE family cell cycle protein, partial [Acinetobacter baumannii]